MFYNRKSLGGREGKLCQTAVVGYARLCSAMLGVVRSPDCNGGSEVCGAVLLGNANADC